MSKDFTFFLLSFSLLWGVVCFLPSPLTGQSEDWVEFKSEEGRFRIMAPGILNEKIDSIDTYIGEVSYHTFFYQPEGDKADNLLYIVSYCDYPENAIHSDSTDLLAEFFEATLEAAAQRVDGEIRYADDVRLKGYPGKLWRIDYLNGRAVVKSRAFLVGRRFYSIQTFMYSEKSLNASSDHFLRSFRLVK